MQCPTEQSKSFGLDPSAIGLHWGNNRKVRCLPCLSKIILVSVEGRLVWYREGKSPGWRKGIWFHLIGRDEVQINGKSVTSICDPHSTAMLRTLVLCMFPETGQVKSRYLFIKLTHLNTRNLREKWEPTKNTFDDAFQEIASDKAFRWILSGGESNF